jgi:Cu2+-containing amine oxidase
VTETPLLSVHSAMRMAKPEAGRAWKIKNPAVVNPITGQPVSFKLIPQTSELLNGLRMIRCWVCLSIPSQTAGPVTAM